MSSDVTANLLADSSGELRRQLFSSQKISRRISEIGAEITEDYSGRRLVIVGILKGAATFTVDLARAVSLPLTMDWAAISRYGKGSVGGTIRVLKDIHEDVEGADVLVVEDILDTGLTLQYVMNLIQRRSPASVNCCVLLRKPHAVTVPVVPRYVGFDIAVDWVAGYGIDYAERHRNLPEIYEVRLPQRSPA